MKSFLEVKFLGTKFTNPLVVPSGFIPELPDTVKAQEAGAGGVVTKSITVLPRQGNPLPRVIRYESGVLNSVGLRNPGLNKGVEQLRFLLQVIKIPVIVSIFSVSVPDFKKLALGVEMLNPPFIELNLSCPNTTNELGESMGMGIDSTTAAISGVRSVVGNKTKLIAKLSPNVSDIGEVAKAAEAAGADAISAINTVGPGMVIDIKTRKPLLGNKEGGVSGPGIRPIAIRCIYDIYKAVKIPIIGMGGIESAKDVIEITMAGAQLIGIGSAIYRHGYKIVQTILDDLPPLLKSLKVSSVTQLIGVAHDQ